MKGLLSLLLVGVILYFSWLTWFGSRGARALKIVEGDILRISAHNQDLKVENQRLVHKIRLLRSDARFQELVVRRELHMVRENEILFLFKPAEP
ncbi:MAG: septum formation initiator family protein [Deltaproteobacteria bacterium]|nr:septum formation initiator family protein [Deltaproteobacteria bacterium]